MQFFLHIRIRIILPDSMISAPFNFFSGKPMPVFANEMTQEVIIREFPYAFTDFRYPGVPEIQLNTIATDPFMIGDIRVVPIQVWHLKMPVLGFRFGDFTYITDANRIDESEKQKIRGSEILVLNALRKEKHISHFNLDEAIAMTRNLVFLRLILRISVTSWANMQM